MSISKKVRLVQALYGAVILSILMQPVAIMGYSGYLWLIFMPLLLFFAFGAQFKIIPSMIVSYICGVVWVMLNGALMGVLSGFLSVNAANFIAPTIMVFGILTVHENLFAKTLVGNVPAVFLGVASTFFSVTLIPSNAPAITPIHLIVFFLYGTMLSVILAGGGFAVCSMIFGKETTVKVLEDR